MKENIGGYIHSFLVPTPEGEREYVAKTRFIPKDLKDKFLEKFGDNLLYTKEKEVDNFLKENKIE